MDPSLFANYTSPHSMVAFALIAKAQRDAGVAGAVGGIGLHDRSLALAALLSARSEPLWVFDTGDVAANDAALSRNFKAVGLDIDDIVFARGISGAALSPSLCGGDLPRFRFVSLNGAPTEEQTRRDMLAATCHLAEGGVIAVGAWIVGVDDISDSLFLPPIEGVMNFMALNRERLAPFLQLTGTIYFTTPSHHASYFAAARFLIARLGAYTDETKSNLWGWQLVSHSVPDARLAQLGPDKVDDTVASIYAALDMRGTA